MNSKLSHGWCFLADRDATYDFGFKLGQLLGEDEHKNLPRVIAAFGNLGAGKTSLAQGLARGIGVPRSTYVNSPTFAIHQAHQAELYHHLTYFHHLDLYRLEDEEELIHLGFEELLESGLTYIEWPQRAPSLFIGIKHLQVHLYHLDEWKSGEFTDQEDGRVIELRGSLEIMRCLSPVLSLSIVEKAN